MSEPEPGLFGRRLLLPRGKKIGGSSSMNAMLYARGNRSDYDRLESELGASGWSHDAVLAHFKRHEHHAEHHASFHRTTDEAQLSLHRERFISAAERLGIPRNAVYNGEHQDGASLFRPRPGAAGGEAPPMPFYARRSGATTST